MTSKCWTSLAFGGETNLVLMYSPFLYSPRYNWLIFWWGFLCLGTRGILECSFCNVFGFVIRVSRCPQQSYEITTLIKICAFWLGQPRHSAKSLAWGHTTEKQQSQDSNPRGPTPDFVFLTCLLWFFSKEMYRPRLTYLETSAQLFGHRFSTSG